MPDWREEPIGRHHDRKSFDCSVRALNEYLDRYARQNHDSGGAKTFVAVPPVDPVRVMGFYSISPGTVEFARVPARLTKKLGRYDVPVFRLGRLAIDRSMQGQGLGGDLLLAAGERALAVATEVGGVALAIDAKDENAARWYERFGALALLDDPLKLILPLDIVADAIASGRKHRR
ncbi:Acetyltransferase (GNAT) family protein [Rhizobiales bacterium GAS188]|nr:Acetyltransferase (GNAT) family protein [Rhizobiales bacterium GAS188]